MPRYRITIEYHGSGFVGWQRQPNGFSVQEALESALKRLTGAYTRVQGAGRTDAGVHAVGQVAHFDLPKPWSLKALRDGVNFHMKPARVVVLTAENAAPNFDARFSATGRRYCYRILNRRSPAMLEAGLVWFYGKPLDEVAMQAAADRLIGHHDFSSFRAVHCQAKSPVKTLDRLDVTRDGDEIRLNVEARSFLHNQVRIFAGTLVRVGEGAWTPDDVANALAARKRAAAGPTAPPDGLCLMSVDYPADSTGGSPSAAAAEDAAASPASIDVQSSDPTS